MTTIAYKDGVLASDSMVSDVHRGLYEGTTQKVFQLSGGCLYASSGDYDDRAVRALLDSVRSPDQLPSPQQLWECDVNADCVLVFPDGQVFIITITTDVEPGDDENPVQAAEIFQVSAPYVAVGSGRQIALGAMWAGRSAAQAIEAACEHNVWTRGPVQSMRLRAAEKGR